MSGKPQSGFLGSTLLSLLVRGGGGFAAFFTSVVVARTLGDVESGLFFLAFALMNVLAVVGRFGLDKVVLRSVSIENFSGNSGAVRGVIVFSFSAVFLGSCVVSAVLFLISDWVANTLFVKPALVASFYFVSMALPMVALCAISAEVLQGLQRFVASIFISAISPAFWLITALIILRYFRLPLTSSTACFFMFMSYLLTFLLALLLLRKSLDFSVSAWMPARESIIDSCMPLYIVDVMAIAVLWAGQLIAGHWLSPGDQACLAAAQRTASLASLLLMALNMVVAPRFAALHHQGKIDQLRELAQRSTLAVTLLAMPLVVAMCLWPQQIMSLFGNEFSRGALVLPFFALGQLINASTGSVGYLLSMSGHVRDLRDITLVSGAFAILLPLCLLPVWGLWGAAVAAMIALSVQNILALLRVRKRLGFWTLGSGGLIS